MKNKKHSNFKPKKNICNIYTEAWALWGPFWSAHIREPKKDKKTSQTR